MERDKLAVLIKFEGYSNKTVRGDNYSDKIQGKIIIDYWSGRGEREK